MWDLVKVLAVASGLVFTGSTSAITVLPTSDPSTLVSSILGPGITLVGTPTLVGVANQQGTFTDGFGSVGFGGGLVLSSGNINQIPGTNTTGPETLGDGDDIDDDISTPLGTGGDASLDTLTGGGTFDANTLEFSFHFEGGVGGDLFFNYVFASEEYLDFVGSEFNDVFGFFLDGVNIALIPGTMTPVAINNVNPNTNPAYYVNNVTNPHGFPVAGLDFKFDGRTTVLTAQAIGLAPGTHTIKLAVADVSDPILDAGVFIQAGSFSTIQQAPGGEIPEPVNAVLGAMSLGALSLTFRRRCTA